MKKTDHHLRWGLICTARINEALIPAIRASTHADLIAVGSRNLKKAQQYAEDWQIPRAYGSYEEILNDPNIDIIYNALPNDRHCIWTLKAIEKGKHVLCEKPLALTTQEVDMMIDAARCNRVILLEALAYHYHPQVKKVQDLIKQGVIGEVQLIRAVYSLNRLRDLSGFRIDPTRGGGSLRDLGCYPISFANCIVGMNPVEVYGWQKLGDTNIDVLFVAQMHFASGAIAQIDCSFCSAPRYTAEVVGTKGMIKLDSPWKPNAIKPTVIYVQNEEGNRVLQVDYIDTYLCEVNALNAYVLNNTSPAFTLLQSRGIVATINALYQSASIGRPIML